MMTRRDKLFTQFEHAIPVLDHGHVRLVDVMGDDTAIVQAARVSYGEGTYEHDFGKIGICRVCDETKLAEHPTLTCAAAERNLIRYLMSNRHTTPFEMCEIKLHIKMPMDAHRQQIRHRTANVNEYSTRYSVALDDMMSAGGEWRLQSASSKQGSSGILEEWPDDPDAMSTIATDRARSGWLPGEHLTAREEELQRLSREVYEERLAFGVAREVARKDLCLSTYTHYYWKIDLHNLMHYLGLRLNPHAQLEIRAFAEAMAPIVQAWAPFAWEAFVDYRLEAVNFSRMEANVLRGIVAEWLHENPEGREKGFVGDVDSSWPATFTHYGVETKRDRADFLRKLGIID